MYREQCLKSSLYNNIIPNNDNVGHNTITVSNKRPIIINV